MRPGAPFVQFTYNAIRRSRARMAASARGLGRVWTKLPAGARLGLSAELTTHDSDATEASYSVRLIVRPLSSETHAAPKILVIPGSLRTGSYNVRLAALATKELTLAEADVTRISLADYPLPIYDADLAAKSGPPFNAVKLKQLVGCAPRRLHRQPRIQRLDPAAPKEHDRLDLGRARAPAKRSSPSSRTASLRSAAPRPAAPARCSRCSRCARCWRSAAARW